MDINKNLHFFMMTSDLRKMIWKLDKEFQYRTLSDTCARNRVKRLEKIIDNYKEGLKQRILK